jgi:hypothetical protein
LVAIGAVGKARAVTVVGVETTPVRGLYAGIVNVSVIYGPYTPDCAAALCALTLMLYVVPGTNPLFVIVVLSADTATVSANVGKTKSGSLKVILVPDPPKLPGAAVGCLIIIFIDVNDVVSILIQGIV